LYDDDDEGEDGASWLVALMQWHDDDDEDEGDSMNTLTVL